MRSARGRCGDMPHGTQCPLLEPGSWDAAGHAQAGCRLTLRSSLTVMSLMAGRELATSTTWTRRQKSSYQAE